MNSSFQKRLKCKNKYRCLENDEHVNFHYNAVCYFNRSMNLFEIKFYGGKLFSILREQILQTL